MSCTCCEKAKRTRGDLLCDKCRARSGPAYALAVELAHIVVTDLVESQAINASPESLEIIEKALAQKFEDPIQDAFDKKAQDDCDMTGEW